MQISHSNPHCILSCNKYAAAGIPAASAADPYPSYTALDARQRELEMALQQRRHQLATQLQAEEEMNCKWTEDSRELSLVVCVFYLNLIHRVH